MAATSIPAPTPLAPASHVAELDDPRELFPIDYETL
jgi:hypothetical protein